MWVQAMYVQSTTLIQQLNLDLINFLFVYIAMEVLIWR